MKRLEVILKRHDQEMLTHNRIFLAGRAPKHNPKIFNETIRDIEGYIQQQNELQSESEDDE